MTLIRDARPLPPAGADPGGGEAGDVDAGTAGRDAPRGPPAPESAAPPSASAAPPRRSGGSRTAAARLSPHAADEVPLRAADAETMAHAADAIVAAMWAAASGPEAGAAGGGDAPPAGDAAAAQRPDAAAPRPGATTGAAAAQAVGPDLADGDGIALAEMLASLQRFLADGLDAAAPPVAAS